MAQFTPTELSEREFTRAIRGYNAVEVDAYIDRVVENYAKLYRDNVAMEKKLQDTERRLREAESKLNVLNTDDALIREALVTAKRTGDAAIEEANAKAEAVLSSVKSGCDAILADFKEKIALQKKTLRELQAIAEAFKTELFEKYRTHIELVEGMMPIFKPGPDIKTEEYAAAIVADLKEEISSLYDVPEIVGASGFNTDTLPDVPAISEDEV